MSVNAADDMLLDLEGGPFKNVLSLLFSRLFALNPDNPVFFDPSFDFDWFESEMLEPIKIEAKGDCKLY